MEAEVKEKNGRRVYESSGMLKAFLRKVLIGIGWFVVGFTTALMIYPIIRP